MSDKPKNQREKAQDEAGEAASEAAAKSADAAREVADRSAEATRAATDQARELNERAREAASRNFAAGNEALRQMMRIPAECARENIRFAERRLQAQTELVARLANCQTPDDLFREMGRFGEAFAADYSIYVKSMSEAVQRTTEDSERESARA